MKNFYIIVDKNNTPVGTYTDEYQHWVDVYAIDIDECDVYEVSETGLEQINSKIEFITEYENRVEGIEFPLRAAKIQSVRNLIK